MLGNYVDAGAGAAAGRQALVPRQRRRDLPVPQPDPRREARHRGRRRRRPRLPDGLLARWSTSTSRSGAACTVAAIRQPISLADQFGVIDVQPDDPTRIREFLEKPKDPDGPARHARTRCSPRWATTSSTPTRSSRRSPATPTATAPSTTWAATSCRRSCAAAQAGVYDFKDNDVPGSTDRDRGYWRDVGTIGVLLRRAHGPGLAAAGLQPLQLRLADLHVLRPAAAGRSWSGRRRAAGRDRRGACSRPGSWSPAARSAGRCSRRPSASAPARGRPTRC